MGRPRKAETIEDLEGQIAKGQARVIRMKAAYDSAVDELQTLLDKRDAMRKDELWKAIVKSGKSYDEILRFINAEEDDEDGQ